MRRIGIDRRADVREGLQQVQLLPLDGVRGLRMRQRVGQGHTRQIDLAVDHQADQPAGMVPARHVGLDVNTRPLPAQPVSQQGFQIGQAIGVAGIAIRILGIGMAGVGGLR